MPIDLCNEATIPLRLVPAELQRMGHVKKVGVSTVYRWVESGVRGVKLEYVQFGGTRCTTKEALQRFVDDLTKPRARTITLNRRQDAASKRLKAALA